MTADLERRLASINWHEFTHPCGFDSREIPSLLMALHDDSVDVSSRAASRLWNVVSHQGNVGPNSVPTLPFLLERLDTAHPTVQAEILDILYQFSSAARDGDAETWKQELRVALIEGRGRIERLANSPHEDVRVFAEMILENIDAPT